jgi:dipeptidase E
LKERLLEYKGILVAWSAGAMNCAEKVYASPELEGKQLIRFMIDGLMELE